MAEAGNYEDDGYGWEEEEEEDQEKMMDQARAERERERSPARNPSSSMGRPRASAPMYKTNLFDPPGGPEHKDYLRDRYHADAICSHNGHSTARIGHTNGTCTLQEWWRFPGRNTKAPKPRSMREVMPRPRTALPPPAVQPSQPPAQPVAQPGGHNFQSSGHMFFMADPSALAGIVHAFQKH